jgi:hypothetical protein
LTPPGPKAASPQTAQFQSFEQSPAGQTGLIRQSSDPPSPYGTNVGLVDGSHTSLLVATSSFMFRHVRRPGIAGDPRPTARA